MVKVLYQKVNFIVSRYLDVIAVLFLVLNFAIWYVDASGLLAKQFQIYQIALWFLVSALALNLHKMSFFEFVRENIFFILIFIVSIYQSFFIIMDFNGIIVDMGLRSNILLMQAFPSFLLILAVFKEVHRKAFLIALVIILGVIFGYASLTVLHKVFNLEAFLGISLVPLGERHQSILNNANALGEYMFLGIFIVFFLSLIQKKLIFKLLTLIPLPIFFYVLILSGSRTAILMSIIFYLFLNLYILYFKRNSRKVLLIGNLVLVIIALLAFLGIFNDLIAILKDNLDLSGREKIWFNTLKIINDHSFRGIGYNNFTYVYNEFYQTITSPHNMLLGVYAELGIFGAFLTISWFVYLIISNHNSIMLHKDKPFITYLILFNAFYATYFIGQLTEYSFLKIGTINIFFLAMQGVNFQILNLVKKKRKQLSYFDYAYMLILIIGVILIITIKNQTSFIVFYMLITFVLLAVIQRAYAYFFMSDYPENHINL